MKKSITSRIKITKNGKGVRRKQALCHFRSKKSSNALMRKRRNLPAGEAFVAKIVKKPGQL